MRLVAALLLCLALAPSAQAKALKIAIIGFQMSSETHARAANSADAAAKAKGWTTTLLNSRGSIPESAAQIESLVQAHPDAIVLCMTKPTELDGPLAAAKAAGIPIVTIASGSSPHTLFDIQANEYQVGSDASLYLLGLMNYRGTILAERFEGNLATRIRGRELDAVLAENPAVKLGATHSMARTGAWQEDVRAGMTALLQREQGRFQGVWASFDGQAFVIDDLLQQAGMKKGQVPLVSADGGQESFNRIRDPNSLLVATVAVPFELMGTKAIDAIDRIVAGGAAKESVVQGPYMLLPSVLVDAHNVPAAGAWPW